MDINLQTRREFLRRTITLASVAWTVPTFLHRTVWAMDNPLNEARGLSDSDGRILVVIQLSGGNDGLNTVVPYTNHSYYKARPDIGIHKDKILKLNDELGLNPELSKFKALYDTGQMALVQGVGYPNPNRSHFRSMEIWHTACDSNKIEKYGWIGRYFDNACKGCDPTVGVNIGKLAPQSFVSKSPIGVSIEDPEMYRWINTGAGSEAATKSAEAFFKKIVEKSSGKPAGASEMMGDSSTSAESLDYLQRTAMNAQLSSDKIRDVVKKYRSNVTYPSSAIGYSLKLVAQMIAGNLPTRVYYVSQGGYDTHSDQVNDQTKLLSELAEAVSAFYQDMHQQRNDKRVLSFTFSEFGRRVAQNGSGGTDHGTAGPVFVFGGAVKPGIYGSHPDLTDLDRGDLKYKTDFRSVYSTVMENWLGTKAESVLGRSFPKLGFV